MHIKLLFIESFLVFRFIFAICLFFVTCFDAELGYDIASEVNTTSFNQLIFEPYPDIDSEVDFDSLISNTTTHTQSLQLTYLSKYASKENTNLLKNKYQYVRPRAPPSFIKYG